MGNVFTPPTQSKIEKFSTLLGIVKKYRYTYQFERKQAQTRLSSLDRQMTRDILKRNKTTTRQKQNSTLINLYEDERQNVCMFQ